MEKLSQGAEKLGLRLTEKQLALLQTYYEELTDWNQRMNLTAITEYEAVQINHFLDSLTVVSVWQPPVNKPHPGVIDIGTGAGVPGIPLKIVFPEICLSLMDSTNKKITFLNHLKQKLGLEDIEVVTGRAEEVAHQIQYRERFDLVLARGVAPLATLVELTLPFCKSGGRLVAHKRGDMEEELNGAKRAITVLGGRLKEVKPIDMAEFPDRRCLVVIEKIASTPARYPRRSGMPVKKPLS
ncbi:MAG: 16S rRNA (guanine(527)-N(7))-methyltransferase RsmG [Dehalococcoidales bacterium]|nr:16S rRNA (guanine(527)-N(7))-methyltransferase RsmG [Dehalococcoidales bacterium]